jgi:hypothetical protein
MMFNIVFKAVPRMQERMVVNEEQVSFVGPKRDAGLPCNLLYVLKSFSLFESEKRRWVIYIQSVSSN